MNLFIDTNIYLSFYLLTSDDVEELRKLILLCKQKRLRLLIPVQVKDELRRNRENKLSDAIKLLKEQKLNLQFPHICRHYPEFEILVRLQEEYEQIHRRLVASILHDEEKGQLIADIVLDELFNCAEIISDNEEIQKQAKVRFDKGNPPGKDGSYGDAIIWETLLNSINNGEILNFISNDKDFISTLNQDEMKEFLVREWLERKKSRITFYRRISDFVGNNFPEIKFSPEYEKELLITDLIQSGTYATTHGIISKLNKYPQFTEEQIKRIISALANNDQVNTIIDDPDVKQFYISLIEKYYNKISLEDAVILRQYINPQSPDENRIIESIASPF